MGSSSYVCRIQLMQTERISQAIAPSPNGSESASGDQVGS